MKPITDEHVEQARRAAEGALLFLRDRTSTPQAGVLAASMLLAVLCRTLKISRYNSIALLETQIDALARANAPQPPAAKVD